MFLNEEISKNFYEIQKILKPDISIEIGAYDADFSKMMLNVAKECYAFEANPYVYDKFKDSLTNIKYINKIVSDTDGSIPFYIHDKQEYWAEGSHSIKERTDNAKIKEVVMVESICLDNYFSEIKNNCCLWIDCEGATEQVLLGSKNIINKVDSIFIEVDLIPQWHKIWLLSDVLKFLSDFEFTMVKMEKFWEGQANCIFVKERLVHKLGLTKQK